MYFDPRWARGHGLERFAASMADLAPPVTRPALYARFGALAWTAPGGLADLVEAIYDDFEDELPDADLGALGLDLIERARPLADRVRGCVWLTLFPSAEASEALAAILRDAAEPPDLRDQAAWTLGFRQVQQRAPSLWWPPDAIAIADAALADAFFADADGALEQLPEACQHVAALAFHDRVAASLASGALSLERACSAIDAFASPALAAALLDRAAALDARTAPTLLPRIALTLGDDAAPRLLAHAAGAPLAPRCEAIWGALAFAPDAAASAADALAAENPMMPQLAQRTAWHRAHPGRVPLPEGLQVGRTTATIPADARPAAARAAAGGFATLVALQSPLPGDAHALWRHCAYLSDDPAQLVACVELDPRSLVRIPALRPRYLDALARAGRFERVATSAGPETALATWLLARGGRPFRALAMRRLARADDLHALAGQALALFAAGRPDLAVRVLALAPTATPVLSGDPDAPPTSWPGPDETWRAARDPLLRAWLSQDLAALAGLAVPAPPGADPDVVDFAALTALERALSTDFAGASVYLAGDFADRPALRAAIERRGALVVSGPFGKVDYVLVGDHVDPEELARLTSLGAIPVSPSHLQV